MDRAQLPMVSTVLARIVKDERRHFASREASVG
jgi:hypothetical protein